MKAVLVVLIALLARTVGDAIVLAGLDLDSGGLGGCGWSGERGSGHEDGGDEDRELHVEDVIVDFGVELDVEPEWQLKV